MFTGFEGVESAEKEKKLWTNGDAGGSTWLTV
jgi:hypothetical protein